MCFNFFMISNTSDDVIRPRPWSCDQYRKMQRFLGKLLYQDFFFSFNIFIEILITLCIDFVSFLKGQILREFQNIEKFVIF